jgi:hypothetical protein
VSVLAPMYPRPKALFCGRLPAEVVVAIPTGGMDVCLLCVIRRRCLRRADYSSRVILPRVVYLNECNHKASKKRRPWDHGKKFQCSFKLLLITIKNAVYIIGFRYTTVCSHVDFCHRYLRNVYFINTKIYSCL